MSVDLHKCGPHCNDYCYSCGRHEPVPLDGYYRICAECFHVYVTEQELIDGHNALVLSMAEGMHEVPTVSRGVDVFACPKCIHDF